MNASLGDPNIIFKPEPCSLRVMRGNSATAAVCGRVCLFFFSFFFYPRGRIIHIYFFSIQMREISASRPGRGGAAGAGVLGLLGAVLCGGSGFIS